jgi:hypothetical protein
MSDPTALHIYGMLAQFNTPAELVKAAERAHQEGYRRMEAYTPFPIEELPEALGHPTTNLPLVIFLGGLLGCLGGFFMQYYTATRTYPHNIGGRPLNSWPMFVPVMFECTILAASLAAVFGMLARNGLPRPHHPLFAIPQFDRATKDRFFLCIHTLDPKYEREATWRFLAGLQPVDIVEVPL